MPDRWAWCQAGRAREGSLLWLAVSTAHAVIRLHAAAALVFKGFLGMLLTMGQGGAEAGTSNTSVGGQTGCWSKSVESCWPWWNCARWHCCGLQLIRGYVPWVTLPSCCSLLHLLTQCTPPHSAWRGLHWNVSCWATGRRSSFHVRGQEPSTELEEKSWE